MLRIRHKVRPRNMPKAEGRGSGPAGRISRLRKTVTALVRHERIEGPHAYIDESRGYVEKLLLDAIRYGDKHKPTMEMADYWLIEKDLVHKLFKVLVPRYADYKGSFTSIHRLPTEYPGGGKPLGMLELRGNPWPPVLSNQKEVKNNLVNVLLNEARREYRTQKYSELASAMDKNSSNTASLSEVTEGLESVNISSEAQRERET